MGLDDLLGRRVGLRVARLAAPGAYLELDDSDDHRSPSSLLVPRAELPPGLREGDELDVFVYLDSEDRPIASTQSARLERDEVAFLRVTALTRVGAFVDWGLGKELLVPFAEQTRELHPGDYEPIGLFLDKSQRLAGTMRIRELLRHDHPFRMGDRVRGEAWRSEPGVGVFAIIERQYLGLLPASEPHRLERGESTTFRVTHVHRDGKFELSLRGLGHEEIADDAQQVLEKLRRPGMPPVSDRSDPQQIRRLFGLSKKAFKRAVGRLLKEGTVELADDGAITPR